MKQPLSTHLLLILLLTLTLGACKKEKSGAEPDPTLPTPEVTSISPKDPQTGDIVTITGKNFGTAADDVKVSIGSTSITISSVTDREIKFTVPADVASGDLSVVIKGKAAAIKDPDGAKITVKPKPVILPTFTAMNPSSGKTGEVITLTGANFSTQLSENKVFFAAATGGTVVLATVKSATATALTVEVPANAITGGILIEVSGTNAVPAAGFNTTFTFNTETNTGGSDVDYINVISGNLNFKKIGTAANEIGTMWYDKAKNFIYYSDYTLLTQTGNKVYKLDPGGNNPPAVLTADERITNVIRITTDAAGNVYVLRYEDMPNVMSLFKITADGKNVTEIKSKFNTQGRYFLFVNANNEICIRPDFRIKQSGEIVQSGDDLPGLQQNTNGAVFNGSTAYVAYTTDNSGYSNNCVFAKWNLDNGSTTNTSFTLNSLFGAYDAERVKSTMTVGYLRYAVDDNENFYTLIDHSYIAGSLSKTWVLNKTKNGSPAATNLGTFNVKFLTPDIDDHTGSVLIVSDARGNLYIKANQKDILRITQ
ncbi:hypothetical protein EOD41_09000 [Mucilaginibacter limnophilus]|uniref:IPT/TIG domain-containing protein n=1 Tax=Mucilaginibacter limnophilus TaxID=1932778 RepID=A0A3S3TIW7_9SPHI|nr:IPT/TIG domain-containing protein [Mucilaginibacter limnophilus]RVU02075.1 hypothetical protein EOD41_09000 [Mucilaginibacter limnophilus]